MDIIAIIDLAFAMLITFSFILTAVAALVAVVCKGNNVLHSVQQLCWDIEDESIDLSSECAIMDTSWDVPVNIERAVSQLRSVYIGWGFGGEDANLTRTHGSKRGGRLSHVSYNGNGLWHHPELAAMDEAIDREIMREDEIDACGLGADWYEDDAEEMEYEVEPLYVGRASMGRKGERGRRSVSSGHWRARQVR